MLKDNKDIERINWEIHILKTVHHPHICQLYEILETAHAIYLIMELAEGGELFDYIVKQNFVEERRACRIFQ
jgi:5'-AMP-activated protein kinase catalytic alpha subunit